MKSRRCLTIVNSILLCFSLVSCSYLGRGNTSQAVTPKQSPSSNVTLPFAVNLQSPTPSPVPSFTAIPSLSVINTTPLPTLMPEAAENLVANLLKTNGGCQLPCWWGWIIPGKTSWDDVDRFVQPFATKTHLTPEGNGVLLYAIFFAVPDSIRLEKELVVNIEVRDGIVQQIFLGQPYALINLLKDYGEPNNILLYISDDTFEKAFSDEGRFELALFLRNKGILAVYDGRMEKTEPLKICMNKLDESRPAVWLWDPARKRTLVEVGGKALFGTEPFLPKFYSLQQVINLDIESFYQTYTNPTNSNACFELLDTFLPSGK